MSKACSKCGLHLPLEDFQRDRTSKSGHKSQCKECRKPGRRKAYEEDSRETEAVERLASNFAALKPEDFSVSVGNDGRRDGDASREKRQDYSKSMGEVLSEAASGATAGRGIGGVLDALSDKSVRYLGTLSEQERRFGNRRAARSFSLAAAHEMLGISLFKAAAERYLTGKIQPKGWATKKTAKKHRRTVVVLLSDLHLGAELSSLDEPVPFGAIEEARRLEYVVRQVADFKPQYREQTSLLVILNGDVIEGALQHDLRDGSPLAEQKVIFWKLLGDALGYLASAFPSVHVECQGGNHGRDKARHQGRATSRKWDGHEWEMYYALSLMCRDLKNVTWSIPFRAVSIVDLYGSNLLVTHGDTEIKLSDPDTRSRDNATALDRINSLRTYGCQIDAVAVGHFHKPRYQPRNPKVVWNGALVPPNGWARTMGHVGEPCGQWIWEAVEGFPVGDLRFIEVGASQDHDESLGKIIRPFRFDR